jgi:hypothetical protein
MFMSWICLCQIWINLGLIFKENYRVHRAQKLHRGHGSTWEHRSASKLMKNWKYLEINKHRSAKLTVNYEYKKNPVQLKS